MTAAGLYGKLAKDRDPFLRRARHAAKYTKPHLISPDEGRPAAQTNTELTDPYQSLGSIGVSTVASKLGLLLIPPSAKFFRYHMDEDITRELPPEVVSEFDSALALRENHILRLIEQAGVRAHLFQAMEHLVVAGNVVFRIKVGKFPSRLYPLDQFVCRRSQDRVLDLILVESVEKDSVPPEVLQESAAQPSGEQIRDSDKVDVYTHIYWDNARGKYREYQECLGVEIPDSQAEYSEEAFPYLVLRWTKRDGENYGRGYADDLIGDLRAFETLSAAMIEAAGIAAWNIWLVKPSSTLRPIDLERAPNGSVRVGNPDDVAPMQKSQYAELRVAFEMGETLRRSLSHAFLMGTAVQRNAERVTAEEIRRMMQELETTLGGIYSLLSLEFQERLVKLVEAANTAKLKKLPEDGVALTIVTGIDALGRAAELDRLDQFIARANATFGPDIVSQYIDVRQTLSAYAAALGLDKTKVVLSEEQIAAKQAEAMQSQILTEAAPQIATAAAGSVLSPTP